MLVSSINSEQMSKRQVKRRLNFDDEEMASNDKPKATKTLYVIEKGSSKILVNVEGCHGEEEILTMKKASPETVRAEEQYEKFFKYLDSEKTESGFVLEPPILQPISSEEDSSAKKVTKKKQTKVRDYFPAAAALPEPIVSLFCDEIMEEETTPESVLVAVEQQVSELKEIIKQENARRVVDPILFSRFVFSAEQLSALISACFEIFSADGLLFTQKGIDLFRDTLIKNCIELETSSEALANVYFFLMKINFAEVEEIRNYFIYKLFERRKFRTPHHTLWVWQEWHDISDIVTEIDMLEYRDARLLKSSSEVVMQNIFKKVYGDAEEKWTQLLNLYRYLSLYYKFFQNFTYYHFLKLEKLTAEKEKKTVKQMRDENAVGAISKYLSKAKYMLNIDTRLKWTTVSTIGAIILKRTWVHDDFEFKVGWRLCDNVIRKGDYIDACFMGINYPLLDYHKKVLKNVEINVGASEMIELSGDKQLHEISLVLDNMIFSTVFRA